MTDHEEKAVFFPFWSLFSGCNGMIKASLHDYPVCDNLDAVIDMITLYVMI